MPILCRLPYRLLGISISTIRCTNAFAPYLVVLQTRCASLLTFRFYLSNFLNQKLFTAEMSVLRRYLPAVALQAVRPRATT